MSLSVASHRPSAGRRPSRVDAPASRRSTDATPPRAARARCAPPLASRLSPLAEALADPSARRLFAFHPHGVLLCGWTMAIADPRTHAWRAAFLATRALTIMPLISEWMLWSGVRPVEKVRVRSAVRRRPLPPERSSDVLERHARLVEKGAAFASASSVWVVVGNHPCGSFVVVVERTPRTARRGVAETPRRGRGSRERRPRVASRDDSRKKKGGRLRSPAVTPPVGRARRRGACAGPRATMR